MKPGDIGLPASRGIVRRPIVGIGSRWTLAAWPSVHGMDAVGQSTGGGETRVSLQSVRGGQDVIR